MATIMIMKSNNKRVFSSVTSNVLSTSLSLSTALGEPAKASANNSYEHDNNLSICALSLGRLLRQAAQFAQRKQTSDLKQA